MSTWTPSRYSSRRRRTGVGGMVLIVLIIAAGIGFSAFRAHYNNHVATCTIVDKDRGYNYQTKSSQYRIYTRQCGVLGNTDEWFVGKTNSADIQGDLQVGHTYRLRIVGWRMSLFSEFPNVVRVVGEVSS